MIVRVDCKQAPVFYDYTGGHRNKGVEDVAGAAVNSPVNSKLWNFTHKCFTAVMLSRPIPFEPGVEDTGMRPERLFLDKSTHVTFVSFPKLLGMEPLN